MKVPQFRLRSLLVLIALTAVLLAGVAKLLWRPGRPYSTVLAQFDPVTILGSRPGYTVQGIAGGATFNIPWGYAFKEWRGVVTASNDPSIHQSIQQSLESYVENVSQGRFHTEGTLAGDPHETSQYARLPSHALIMFNEREWHGDMHIWLFPDSSGSSVGYAIYLREQRLE